MYFKGEMMSDVFWKGGSVKGEMMSDVFQGRDYV